MPPEHVKVALVYPSLLGLYGDRGNAVALRHRAALRGIATEITEVNPGDTVPADAHIYLVGGAEDLTMAAAAALLFEQPGLRQGIDDGAGCLAVCAGFQLLSKEYVGPDLQKRTGLGFLDAACSRLDGPRAVGEIMTRSEIDGSTLLGYENHQGDAVLGPEARPLGIVEVGQGNGHDRLEGALQGRIIATYLHGPVLVRNPALADILLSRAVGHELEPAVDPRVERLRRERLQANRGLRARLLGRS